MAMIYKPKFMMMVAVISMAVVLMSSSSVKGQAECGVDVSGLVSNCGPYVQKTGPVQDPSQACCSVVKKIKIPCACKYVTPQIVALVDMNKALHVASYCGNPLRRGSKCGSYRVPNSA